MEYQCGQRQQPLLSGCPSSKILRPLCLVALALQFPIYQISFSSFKNHKKGQHGANYTQTECSFRRSGTVIPFLSVRSTAVLER